MTEARERRAGILRFNGPRGAGLFSAGCVCVARGLFLLPLSSVPPPPARGIEAISAGWRSGVYVYAALWLAVGLYAMARSFRVKDALACAAIFGLCGLWGVGFLVSGLQVWLSTPHLLRSHWLGLDHARRDWESAASYLGFSVLGGYWSRMVNPRRRRR